MCFLRSRNEIFKYRMVRVTAAVSLFFGGGGGALNGNYSAKAVRDEYGDRVGWCHSSF